MNIEVGNVSCTGAIISWSSSEPCLEDYYHIMYRPNWNSIFSGYLRYSFHHEEKVPRTISSVVLEHLAPSTLYFLCISCKKAAFPYSHYCTMFHTLDKSPLAAGGSLVDPQISLWVLMAILLACFTAVLAFICLQFWCIRCHEPRWSYRAGHMEEANGLVRWPEEAPALGQREEDLQGLPWWRSLERTLELEQGLSLKPTRMLQMWKSWSEEVVTNQPCCLTTRKHEIPESLDDIVVNQLRTKKSWEATRRCSTHLATCPSSALTLAPTQLPGTRALSTPPC